MTLEDIKILILEDTESDVFLINRQLSKSGLKYSLDVATNKKGFIDYMDNNTPDIILSDYVLPDFNGLEALRYILDMKKNIPFIIITGAINEETAVKCIKSGADDYLTKENLIRLPTSIKSALENRFNLTMKELAESELKNSEEKYRTLFENSEDAILILKDNVFVDCNESACKLFGVENKSQLISKHPSIISPEIQDNKKPSYNEAERMIALAKKNGVNKFEWMHKKYTGELFFAEVLLTKIPYKDNFIIHSVVRDITVGKRSESDLKQLANELQTLIKSVNTPIIGVDMNGKITEWNKAATEFTGQKKITVLESNFIDTFIHEKHRDYMQKLIFDALKGYNKKNHEVLIKSDKGYREVLLNTTTHRNSSGEVIGVILIGQDITEIVDYREELENKIQERTQELKTALEKERELGELKSRFVSMASHEFRTPLAAIGFASGFLKKYKDRIDIDTYNKKLDKIEDQIGHMTALLDDVLTIGKADSKTKFNPTRIKLSDFFYQIVEEVRNATNNKHRIILNEFDNGITIDLDQKLGRNIFINLLTNAIKFSPDKTQIIFENFIENDQLISKITDFGIGIPDDELRNLFTPFYRAKNTDTIQGTGLGLSIVKEAIEAHKGNINVMSDPINGTVFTVSLPLVQINSQSDLEH